MTPLRHFGRLTGFLLLAVVVVFLLTTPGNIFSHNVSFIYPSLDNPQAGEIRVQTKMDFGDQQHVESFPMEIGEWRGENYDLQEAERMRDQLGADVLMMRDYTRPGLWRGLTFLIMQSESRASFHPPQVCYPATGWKVQEEGEAEIPMPESFWEDVAHPGPIPAEADLNERYGPVKMSRLLITIGDDGDIRDRHVVLYCYVRDSSYWGDSDTVTMLRVSGPTLPAGSYQGMLDIEKEFLADVMPLLFQAREKEDTIIVQMAGMGAGGYFLIFLVFAVPLAVAFRPELGRLYRRMRPGS